MNITKSSLISNQQLQVYIQINLDLAIAKTFMNVRVCIVNYFFIFFSTPTNV
jgi:hypothetical protein